MHAEPLTIPEEEEQAVTPGDDSNDDPTPPLPVDPPGAPARNPAVDTVAQEDGAVKKEEKKEEPEIAYERDIPSDGRDPEGEGMIREVEKPEEPASDPSDPPERK
ncbi:hypothetical protein [Polaromonas sp.]|uniref:hypothetical protein n=1 Tax=Polaromonas sp. TaxID=1869339 RepID=UPI003264D2E1